MRICLSLLGFVAACASTGTRSTLTVFDDQLAPGLHSGSHKVMLNGARHYWRVAGPMRAGAPPVVFLHGGPGQGSAHFDALAGPHMERELRMVYFDQRGSGRERVVVARRPL